MRIFVVIVVTLFLISCDNNDEPVLDSNQIVMGDYNNMLVKSIDKLLIGNYANPLSLDIDINSDLISDFSLTSGIFGSIGTGMHPSSIITSLNSNSLLYGYLKDDTTFLQQTTSIWTTNNEINIAKKITYSCYRRSPKDSIGLINRNNFEVMPTSSDDSIKMDGVFKSDTITLVPYSYDSPSYIISHIGDTIRWGQSSYLNDCNSFPNGIRFIGIKLKKDNIEKLGWIKLSITNNNNIMVFESAIQK